MIGQTLAIFVDAYRELNSKKLFWIVMVLSGLVVAAFATITLTQTGIRFVVWDVDTEFNLQNIPPRVFYYNIIFVELGVKWWLGFAATILALISTAGVFPDLVSSGSIEAMLARPISRTRLFLTRYVSGLLFVVLQVGVFCVASFLLIGIKADLWDPKILLGIPIIALFYSYLFCLCALIGLWTRSTIAALLLTILFWLLVFAVQASENFFFIAKVDRDLGIARHVVAQEVLDKQISALEDLSEEADDLSITDAREKIRRIVRWSYGDDTGRSAKFADRIAARVPNGEEIETASALVSARLEERRESRELLQTYTEHAETSGQWVVRWHNIMHGVATVLPKTGETKELLNRYLVRQEDVEDLNEGTGQDETGGLFGTSRPEGAPQLPADIEGTRQPTSTELSVTLDQESRDRPLWWIVGTSLGFEAFILLLASVYFARRDF